MENNKKQQYYERNGDVSEIEGRKKITVAEFKQKDTDIDNKKS